MATDIDRERWYVPSLEYPKYCLQPLDLDLGRALYRRAFGLSVGEDLPVITSSVCVEDTPWLTADAGVSMFSPAGREVIDRAARPGGVQWVPLVFVGEGGRPRDDYAAAILGEKPFDVLSEANTTRSALGIVIRWVLDREKLGDRRVFVVPGAGMSTLVMLGSVIQELVDIGAQGVVLEKARVMPRDD